MGLKEGDLAPNFSVKNEKGETVSLRDFKGKTVVLYFYPKDMTPGCTIEACDFRDQLKKFGAAGAVVLGVSKDPEDRHQKFIQKYDLNFPLLADTDEKLCKDYDVIQEKSLYGRKFMGIERSTFVIGPDGRIKKVWNKVKVAGHVDDVLGIVSGKPVESSGSMLKKVVGALKQTVGIGGKSTKKSAKKKKTAKSAARTKKRVGKKKKK